MSVADDGPADAGTSGALAALSKAKGLAFWTLVSRATGLVRVIVAGVVLGPTFFANVFQTVNTVPNVTYNLFAGSLLTSLLVPPLVARLAQEGSAAAALLARRLLTVVVLGACAVGVVVLTVTPLIAGLISAPIADRAVRASSHNQALLMLLLVVPQLVLYAVATVGAAVQNAHGRFALAGAAPTVENVGLILTLLLCARWFGRGLEATQVPTGQLVLLGVGSTVAVLLHASIQAYGARRCGVAFRPARISGDPAVAAIRRHIATSIGTASLGAGWVFAATIAAGLLPGGVVAFQTGMNFSNVPLAIGARAIGTTLLPGLSTLESRADRPGFATAYRDGIRATWLVTVPIITALVLLAGPVAHIIAFGPLNRADPLQYLVVCLVTLGIAAIGTALYEVARAAAYALHDTGSSLKSSVVRMVVILVGVGVATRVPRDASVLVVIGLFIVVSEAAGALVVDAAVRRRLTAVSPRATLGSLAQSALLSVTVLAPLTVLSRVLLQRLIPGGGWFSALVSVALVSLTGAPILGWLHLRAWRRAGGDGSAGPSSSTDDGFPGRQPVFGGTWRAVETVVGP